MNKQAEIPCASCNSWKRKQKKFLCNPDSCSELTAWLFTNVPQLSAGGLQMQVHPPEIALQYIV